MRAGEAISSIHVSRWGTEHRVIAVTPKSTWRVRLAFSMFLASVSWPLALPIMGMLGVSGKAIAGFSAFMLVAAELLLLAGAAIAGKEGFSQIKQVIFSFIKTHGPPDQVSRARYCVGLILFVVPLLYALLGPYLGRFVSGLRDHSLALAIVGDVALLMSIFVLGGDFWDKLRSLFLHEAKAKLPFTDKELADLPSSEMPSP